MTLWKILTEQKNGKRLKQFVYQIKKSDFMFGLKKEIAERAWNDVADKDFVSLEFDYYENALAFSKRLVKRYSILRR